MTALVSLHTALFTRIERAEWLLPTIARLLFAAILLVYYWNSGLTKLGDGLTGLFNPAVGAYAQIFPKAAEAVTYDISKLSLFHHLTVLAGTWAEFILPALIVLGLLARLASLGMAGFIVVQSLTDLFGHGGLTHEGTLGAWFDTAPDAIILDQRALWIFLLLVIVVKGAGPLSLDRLLSRAVAPETTSRG